MKFDRQKAFPNPVLRPFSDDYAEVEFQVVVDFEITEGMVKAHINYALSSDEILDQIQQGNAEYVSIISCRDTYHRKVLKSSSGDSVSEFNIHDLRGEVRVDAYVYASRDIKNFTTQDINSEFGSGPFTFTAGDVLAQDESQIFYIDRDLFKPVTSVFELVKQDNLSNGEWSISFDQDHIQIGLSQYMKEKIDDARNTTENRAILLNSIYFASVMQAVQKLKESSDEYEGRKWAEVFMMQLHNKGIDLSSHDSYIIAERLMKYPLQVLDHYIFQGS
jgi:hypothetical protein